VNATIIEDHETQLLEAMKAHNIVQLDQLLHDDLLFIIPDGSTITKKMDLDAHRSGAMVIDTIETSLEKISMIQDAAVVVLHMETKGSMLGQPIEGKFRYIRVWKKIGESYQVIAGSCTSL
jgi:hypothetical protein